ncbi:hypothetical protein BD289DRAFT_432498 [Coniella lustricola]|uniref:Secreted protein n=1 Tax=Coniella lustricola TaxID=2025994 RepID=A0A2T3A9Q8_9PEZI|nr:hypothetical protein BD289DRAFT_432498 [Coniella lustricola]
MNLLALPIGLPFCLGMGSPMRCCTPSCKKPSFSCRVHASIGDVKSPPSPSSPHSGYMQLVAKEARIASPVDISPSQWEIMWTI